jgi:hypothetical protein
MEEAMANREQRSNKEAKKPKKAKVKGTAAQPSQKSQTWDPNAGKSQQQQK